MKKTFTVLSAAALAVSLAACTPRDNTGTGTRATNYTAPRALPGTGVNGTRTAPTDTRGYRAGTTGTTGITGTGTATPGNYGTGTGIYGGPGPGATDPLTPGYDPRTRDSGRYRTDTYGNVRDTRDGMFQTRGFNNTGTTTNGYRGYSTTPDRYRGSAGTAATGLDRYSVYRAHDGRTTSTQSAGHQVGFVYIGKTAGTTGAKGTQAAGGGTSATARSTGTTSTSRTTGTTGMASGITGTTGGAGTTAGTTGGAGTAAGTTGGAGTAAGTTGPQGQTMTPHGTPMVYVDRQNLAYAIANAVKAVPGCQAATVLTTDNQAFVGCDTTGLSASDAHRVLRQAHTASENVCPRYYKVYSTNDGTVTNKIHQNPTAYANKTDKQFEQMIGYPSRITHATTSTTGTSGTKASASPTGGSTSTR
ncbi:hypothetical protein PP175_21095 [Aneurinibacillus sp. Ricciae_BoGa-3]|uniref:YhcN/YlaJ family sporulation lipoprotein n=1 Tax=Aneurinibacillus sp. Ricciae_BoGa-3 TaxID=3022697 RepID=UPI00233FE030|nr:YhcN/YlaJ family sporulation lipoprotein [Aneurinibacillus sp. Ricciae_BoGa-3]WCK53790.1 hypothetical protein PP175_21095 [Aneurinibacillus sp. Ricciae_BoGa-3]